MLWETNQTFMLRSNTFSSSNNSNNALDQNLQTMSEVYVTLSKAAMVSLLVPLSKLTPLPDEDLQSKHHDQYLK